MSAREIRSLLAKKSVSPQELLTAANNRINEVDSHVNALPTLCFERAYSLAKKLDYSETPLKGIPIAIKDLMAVSGVRTTWGSRVYENHVPTKSDLLIDRIESNGAIIYAKSNTPEFGAGANTFNDIFGTTLNPWNTSLSAAGSSGGSAVALATGMAWLATGSDLGGSLRNPASFCGVVGLRPTIGRIPADPGPLAFDRMSVDGPMARNIGDVAMLFDNMVGRHDRDPISHFDVPKDFELAVDAKVKPKRIAFSRDFGVTPVDEKIANICKFAAEKFCEIGVPVEEAHPDFSGLQHVFQTLRAISFAANLGPLLNKYRKILKPEIVWNIEKGLKLTSEEIVSAMAERSRIYAGAVDFFNKYDLLLSPATIVAPYPASTRYVESVGEHTFSNYIEWCSIAYAITIIGAPALSIPCGFTDTKLPVGLQMVGKPGGEAALLGAAALLEESLEILPSVPIDPK
ncbi:MAG: amidase [Acidiferrobacteraceae bacterium]|nr:amidase [Acidiferrobacteraceae bacterium]